MTVMSASLIDHWGSSTFRLSTAVVSMSLAGSRFSSESAPASIDAVTFALIGRYQPGRVAALRIIGFADRVAGLPLVTSISTPAPRRAALRRALEAVFSDPNLKDTRARLLLTGCSFPSDSVYQAIAAQEETSAKLGYPVLA
jgi:hypothetical protein